MKQILDPHMAANLDAKPSSPVTDYLEKRQTQGLGSDRAELNRKLEAIATAFGIAWLEQDVDNPIQVLWASRDALATDQLLNLGDAIENLGSVDRKWVEEKVTKVKGADPGNRAGAIFELLGLNLFLAASNDVEPAAAGNPGFDGIVNQSDGSTLPVSIKNHGMSSYEKRFRNKAAELDRDFQDWLQRERLSGGLRVTSLEHLDEMKWKVLEDDIRTILAGHRDGSSKDYKVRGNWKIELLQIPSEYLPLSPGHISSLVFINAKSHNNEQNKFIEDVRKGCANLDRHTRDLPPTACPILLVRLHADASAQLCTEWAEEYFRQFPDEKIGAIVLYQTAIVTSDGKSSLAHYVMPILGPAFPNWSRPEGCSPRRLPNMSVLVGVILASAAKKVIPTEKGQVSLDGYYSYQRADIFRRFRIEAGQLNAQLSNPAPAIRVHAELEIDGEVAGVLQMITPKDEYLLLLP